MKAILSPQSYFGTWSNLGPLEYDRLGAYRNIKFPFGIGAKLKKNMCIYLYCDYDSTKITLDKITDTSMLKTYLSNDSLVFKIIIDSDSSGLFLNHDMINNNGSMFKMRKIEIDYEYC